MPDFHTVVYNSGNFRNAVDAANHGAAYLIDGDIQLDHIQSVVNTFQQCLGNGDIVVASLPADWQPPHLHYICAHPDYGTVKVSAQSPQAAQRNAAEIFTSALANTQVYPEDFDVRLAEDQPNG